MRFGTAKIITTAVLALFAQQAAAAEVTVTQSGVRQDKLAKDRR